MDSKAILITGSHRCGSTWLAAMLGESKGTTVIQEPFNVAKHFYALDGLAKDWYTYAPALDQDLAVKAFEKVLHGKAGKAYERRQLARYLPWLRRGRPIVKDPIAAFSAEWVSQNFALDVIVLIRHPAAFAASLKRLNWHFPFEDLARQERLMDEVLSEYRNRIHSPPTDIVGQASLLWVLIYSTLRTFAQRNPDWKVIRHEDVSRDPEAFVCALYSELGLAWTEEVRRRVRELSSAENPVDPVAGVVHSMQRDSRANIKRWAKVLSNEEVGACRKETAAVADLYYSDESWQVP